MNTPQKEVRIERWENGFYWIIDIQTGEPIDGDRRKYVVVDMCKRWNYKVIK